MGSNPIELTKVPHPLAWNGSLPLRLPGSNPIELTEVPHLVQTDPSGVHVAVISPDSPCTKVCVLDEATGWCLGCGRTGAEIAGWLAMGVGERTTLKQALPDRLAQIDGARLTPARAASQG